MTYIITNKCIACDRCLSQCPTGAIKRIPSGERYYIKRIQSTEWDYWIDPNLCNSCIGHYSVPQCAATCPTSRGCIPSLSETRTFTITSDYWESWSILYNRLVAQMKYSKNAQYWEQWFTTYSQRLSQQFQQCNRQIVGGAVCL